MLRRPRRMTRCRRSYAKVAEKVYGYTPGGFKSDGMMEQMLIAENGSEEGLVCGTNDVATLLFALGGLCGPK